MATSVRGLVVGSGTLTVSSVAAGRGAKLTFSASQSFKRGETIQVGALPIYRYTIDQGSDKIWYAHQPSSGGSGTFYRTDPSTSRTKGSAGTLSDYTPKAQLFLYVALLDTSDNFDWYTYVDTVEPQYGLHPYTRDRYTGRTWITQETTPDNPGTLVADVANRIAALDSQPPILSA